MVSEVQFFELRKKIHGEGGNGRDFMNAYRELSGSKATDQSLSAALSNRATALRKDLMGKGLTEEQVNAMIPRFPRSTNTAANREASLDAIIQQATAVPATTETPAKPKRNRSKKDAE